MGVRVLHILFSLHVLSTRQQLMFVCLCTYVRGGGGGGLRGSRYKDISFIYPSNALV